MRLVPVVALLLTSWTPILSAQELALAERGPRFLFASSTRAEPVELDAGSSAVLRRVVSLTLERPTVGNLLESIERQAGLSFAFDRALIRLDRPVELRADAISVAAALTAILAEAGVDVLLSSGRQIVLVERHPRAVPMQSGTIVGRVTDAKTGAALAGATVVIAETTRGSTAGDDGRYRLADVPVGTHTVRARYIGYAPGVASVAVSADQEVTADFALEKSVQQLDEVVTTSTLIPTERKALPTPISVITGDEIQQKGYQRVDQIFRGDVPGAFAWDLGARAYSSEVNIRGTSTLGVSYVKTYIDGVEVADPAYIATIDPSSIAHVEVLRGPQGSTMYGSNASGGVLQIFTKRGSLNAARPQLEAKTSGGLIESRWNDALQQDHALAIAGEARGLSYRLGGGFLQAGDWVPGAGSTGVTVHGGVRGTHGPLTADLFGRFYDHMYAPSTNPDLASVNPFLVPADGTGHIKQQSYGLTLRYAATPRWQHSVTLGHDRTGNDYSHNSPQYLFPGDSLLYVSAEDQTKVSVAYHTSYEASLGAAVRGSITAGADHWLYHKNGFSAYGTPRTTGPIPVPADAYRYRYGNSGGFTQAQLGFQDALFITAGLRVEDNQNFGRDFGLLWAPRIGASYVQTIGALTAKVRVAYGEATRPPPPGTADGIKYGTSSEQAANPNLGPERQVGADAGVELYFGRRASLDVTYYDQTAVDLLDAVVLATTPVYTFQFQNVGRIRNKGWEFQGRLNLGQLALSATYSRAASVVRTLSSTYTGDLRPGDQMRGIPPNTVGATLSYSLPRTAITLAMTYVGSWTNVDWVAVHTASANGTFTGSYRDYYIDYPSLAKFNLATTHALTERLSAFLQLDNLANRNGAEGFNLNANSGRVSRLGLRARF